MKSIILIISVLVSAQLLAQHKQLTSDDYIETYKDIAVSEMNRTGIPASITLSQGMLESGYGNSKLSVKANNHFGIKCHDWKGPKIYHDDDKKGECFRKYKSAQQSYTDHSDFLTGSQRYRFLFDYKTTDYKSWAKGLKKAGYATARDYDRRLIELIERYSLYEYDRPVVASNNQNNASSTYNSNSYSGNTTKTKQNYTEQVNASKNELLYNNNVKFIIIHEGQSYKSLESKYGLTSNQIKKYNDIKTKNELVPGQRIYLQPKRKKASVQNKIYTFQEGDSMYMISQKFAIKLSELYKKNGIKPGANIKPGTVIQLRKRIKSENKTQSSTNHQLDYQFDFE